MASSLSDSEFPCSPCHLVFPSWKLLWDHKCYMRDQGWQDHKNCVFCGARFEVAKSELLHVQRAHEPSQNLHCPGCGRGPFARVGTLIAHLERGQCTRISSGDLVMLREMKLDFHRELEKRSDEPAKGSFINYMSNIQVPQWTDVVEAPSGEAPGELTETDFPGLPQPKMPLQTKQELHIWKEKSQEQKNPASVQLPSRPKPAQNLSDKWNGVLLKKQDIVWANIHAAAMKGNENPSAEVSDQSLAAKWRIAEPDSKDTLEIPGPIPSLAAKWQGGWGTKDIQASIAKSRENKRIVPTPQTLAETTRAAREALAEAIDMDDPAHPYFNASTYYSTVINKYVCPKLGCGKYWDTKHGIVGHLKSPVHGDKSYQCPKCSRLFKSVEAITYHAESPGHCRIRDTEQYGAFIDQITGGIVSVDANASNDSPKYRVEREAVKRVFCTALDIADTLDSESEHPFEATGRLGDDRMARRWARRIERTCCSVVQYFPLLFVYGLTTWAVYTVVNIGSEETESAWLGTTSSVIGVIIYLLANWSYTVAVFTPAGSTTTTEGYGMLPTAQMNRPATSFTVKSNGELRFCKKCQARKPDRAHHCSTCQRCVLKMDHHCPWLATCVGLRNYKPFLLFLSYTTLLCFYSFAVSGTWVWTQIISGITEEVDNLMPVNYIMLSVMSGIIGIVLGIFTGWHISLSLRGQTTIECLEKTRYLSPLRRSYNRAHDPRNQFHPVAQQIVDFHTNALPGITAPEEGEEQRWAQDRPVAAPIQPPPRQRSYAEMEREQSRRRYEEYLDEQDSEKLPSAFDLGWRSNMTHLLGPTPLLWFIPVCNTSGDGWAWEASPAWLEACDRVRIEREQQRQREINAGWGEAGPPPEPPSYYAPQPQQQQQQPRAPTTKADRLLGRDPNVYDGPNGSNTVPMRRLSPRGRTIEQELEDIDNDIIDFDSDEEEQHQQQQKRPNGGGLARMNSNGSAWGRGGASGMLRSGQTPRQGSGAAASAYEDEGVD